MSTSDGVSEATSICYRTALPCPNISLRMARPFWTIGCSTGTFLREIFRKNCDRCPTTRYIGIDIEDKFSKYWYDPTSDLVNLLVAHATTFQIPKCSSVTSIFSLGILSSDHRRQSSIAAGFAAMYLRGHIVYDILHSKNDKLKEPPHGDLPANKQ